MKCIQDLLGHSSIMVTIDRNGYLMPETNKKETELLDETVFCKKKASGYKSSTYYQDHTSGHKKARC
jgi:hypothetical protein